MTVTASTRRALDAVLDVLESTPTPLLREALAQPLLRLVGAEFLASYVRGDADRPYRDRVSINMSDENLRRYESYFQFHDPVTPIMATQRRAAIVDTAIDRRRLEQTEFYNDFLRADGLHHGINYFGYRRDEHLGDLRLWRSRSSRPFDEHDRMLLDLVGEAFRTRLAYAHDEDHGMPDRLAERLTPREREIAVAVAQGATDGELSARFHISYGTVRTHLSHIFEKWGVDGRLGVIAAMRQEIGEFADAPEA